MKARRCFYQPSTDLPYFCPAQGPVFVPLARALDYAWLAWYAGKIKRRKRKTKDLASQFESTCGWCGKYIPPDTEVFGRSGKARPGIDLSNLAGQVIPVHILTAEKTVLIAVVGKDSDARREGYDRRRGRLLDGNVFWFSRSEGS
jgi:hypothetical protein